MFSMVHPYSIIDAREAFGAKLPPTRYDLSTLIQITHCNPLSYWKVCRKASQQR